MVKVAPVRSNAFRSQSGQFHKPTPKPISWRRAARQRTGLSSHSISAQAASWKVISNILWFVDCEGCKQGGVCIGLRQCDCWQGSIWLSSDTTVSRVGRLTNLDGGWVAVVIKPFDKAGTMAQYGVVVQVALGGDAAPVNSCLADWQDMRAGILAHQGVPANARLFANLTVDLFFRAAWVRIGSVAVGTEFEEEF